MWKAHLHSEYMVIKFSCISSSYTSSYSQQCILTAWLYIYSSDFWTNVHKNIWLCWLFSSEYHCQRASVCNWNLNTEHITQNTFWCEIGGTAWSGALHRSFPVRTLQGSEKNSDRNQKDQDCSGQQWTDRNRIKGCIDGIGKVSWCFLFSQQHGVWIRGH